MRQPAYAGQFKRDVKQARRRGKDLGKLKTAWEKPFPVINSAVDFGFDVPSSEFTI